MIQKLFLKVIIAIVIIPSCCMNKKVLFEGGKIIIDNSGNAVFIPKNLRQKDLVHLSQIKKGDSIQIKSDFSREHINISYFNIGDNIIKDSINIRLIGKDSYPIGLTRVDFFKDQEIISSYSPLSGCKSAYIGGATSYMVDVFGAKSDLIQFNIAGLKDTLLIYFDYLTPEQLEKYTFIDFSFPISSNNRHVNISNRIFLH